MQKMNSKLKSTSVIFISKLSCVISFLKIFGINLITFLSKHIRPFLILLFYEKMRKNICWKVLVQIDNDNDGNMVNLEVKDVLFL